jgi:hypothetical protein
MPPAVSRLTLPLHLMKQDDAPLAVKRARKKASPERFPRKPAGGSKAQNRATNLPLGSAVFVPQWLGHHYWKNLERIGSLRSRGTFFGRPAETIGPNCCGQSGLPQFWCFIAAILFVTGYYRTLAQMRALASTSRPYRGRVSLSDVN